MHTLGRRAPTDFAHIDKYPLTALGDPPTSVPVIIGVNWYTAFDKPEKDAQGHYWIGRDGNLGTVRGGHCVCLRPKGRRDPVSWWGFYDQQREGKCVGMGASRMMSLLNRKRYDATWLWNEAKKIDEWPDTNPGDPNGTSVRAALDVLRSQGHCPSARGKTSPADPAEGIAANRWATSPEDVLATLGTPGRQYVDILNSWGRAYPHVVRMPIEVLERLRQEDGELGIATDR